MGLSAQAYDVARESIVLPSDEYVLPSGDRDAWSEISFVGRVHEEFVEPAAPIHKRPAVRIDTDDRPSIGNHLMDLFDAIGEGMDLGVHDARRVLRWLFTTCAGGITLLFLGSLLTMYALDILRIPHLGG